MNRDYKIIFKDLKANKLYLKDYYYEYVIFSREKAINIISELIKIANKIEIFHRPIILNDYYKKNDIIKAINDNKNANINYYSNFNEKTINESNKHKVFVNDNVKLINIKYNVGTYHHKEMKINDDVLIFGSFNFFTNSVLDKNDKNFYLENVIIWVKRSDVNE